LADIAPHWGRGRSRKSLRLEPIQTSGRSIPFIISLYIYSYIRSSCGIGVSIAFRLGRPE
jgi:hypothetical protein